MAGLALAFMAMAGAGDVRAQTPEAEALGARIAHLIFEAVDFDAVMIRAVREKAVGVDGLESRPEWVAYLREAMAEEIAHDMPAFERLFGLTLAKSLSVEELKAGIIIMSDPTIQATMAAGAQKKETPPGQPSREAERAAGSAAGRGFLKRMDRLETMFDDLEGEFLGEIMPGTFRRLADKIDAGEQARKTAAKP